MGIWHTFARRGDGVVDVQLIADLHKHEVYQIGQYLGIPKSILEPPPRADLWEGQEDAQELGFSYDFIELFTGVYLQMSKDRQADFLRSLDADTRTYFMEKAQACTAIPFPKRSQIDGYSELVKRLQGSFYRVPWYKQMNITVIGVGRLGLGLALLIEKAGYDVLGVDVGEQYVAQLNDRSFRTKEPDYERLLQQSTRFRATTDLQKGLEHADVIFVVVPTPNSGGELFLRP